MKKKQTQGHVYMVRPPDRVENPVPRELGAALATKLCARANLPPECSRIVIASGAGAGLAAVYNVPLGG